MLDVAKAALENATASGAKSRLLWFLRANVCVELGFVEQGIK